MAMRLFVNWLVLLYPFKPVGPSSHEPLVHSLGFITPVGIIHLIARIIFHPYRGIFPRKITVDLAHENRSRAYALAKNFICLL